MHRVVPVATGVPEDRQEIRVVAQDSQSGAGLNASINFQLLYM